jgi:hypothetical protein
MESPRVSGGVSGHLQVRGDARARKYDAHWTDAGGVKRTRTLGKAHVRDSGKRTPRKAVIWRARDGSCPRGSLTPKMAEELLDEILEDARTPLIEPSAYIEPDDIPTFGDAVDGWLEYLEVERRRKYSTLRDARNKVGNGPHGLCVWPQPGRYSIGHTGILR